MLSRFRGTSIASWCSVFTEKISVKLLKRTLQGLTAPCKSCGNVHGSCRLLECSDRPNVDNNPKGFEEISEKADTEHIVRVGCFWRLERQNDAKSNSYIDR